MSRRLKIFVVVVLMSVVWLAVLLRLGMWRTTMTPADGYVSRTFEGWAEYPPSRHLFLAQLSPDDFANGRVYVSGPYPSIFVNFLLLAPVHYLLGVPYNVAHNLLPFYFVSALMLLVILAVKRQVGAIAEKRNLLFWLLVFMALGISITDPLPWTSSFNATRSNPHIVTAGLFCYLSTWVYRNQIPKTPYLVVGIILALLAPTLVPAWILAGLFFHKSLRLERKWVLQVLGVCGLAAINMVLPRLVCYLAGVKPTGSSMLVRSGLDGSLTYLTNIPQAIISPADPRHWPTWFYFALTAMLAVGFHLFFKGRNRLPLQQALFLLIPYSTFAIFLPQLTSIHPYTTDLFILVPATFLMTFWSLQRPFWRSLTGKTFVGWFLLASLVVMSNLLTVAQMPRFATAERFLPYVTIVIFAAVGLVYVGSRVRRRFSLST